MKTLLSSLLLLSTLLLAYCGGSGGTGSDSPQTPSIDINIEESNALSNDTSLVTTIGSVDGLSIIDIPFNTVIEDFINGITTHEKANFNIYETDGTTPAMDLKSTYRLVVIAEDNTAITYVLSVLPDPSIVNGYTGFDLDSADYTVVGATLTEGLNGNTSALDFDGTPSVMEYVVQPDSEDLTLRDQGTVEVWVNARSIVNYAGIVSKGESKTFNDEAYGLQLYRHAGSNARLLFFLYGDAGNWIGIHGTFDLQVDTWYHIVGTWDETTMKLYVNGVLDGEKENTTGGVRDTDGGLTIGAQLTEKYNNTYGNLGWDGIIDSVVIMNEIMEADEVLERYNNVIE